MSGIVGQFFKEFGLHRRPVRRCSHSSCSFTLTPMLASRWLRSESEHDSSSWRGLDAPGRLATSALRTRMERRSYWALGHRKTVVAVALLAFVGAVAMIPLRMIGTEFLPSEDQSEVYVTVEMPPGTTLSATNDVVSQLEKRLAGVPEVASYFSTVGSSTVGFLNASDSRFARIDVTLVAKNKRHKSIVQMSTDLKAIGDGIPDLTVRTALPAVGGDTRQPFLAQLTGDDPQTLRTLAARDHRHREGHTGRDGRNEQHVSRRAGGAIRGRPAAARGSGSHIGSRRACGPLKRRGGRYQPTPARRAGSSGHSGHRQRRRQDLGGRSLAFAHSDRPGG